MLAAIASRSGSSSGSRLHSRSAMSCAHIRVGGGRVGVVLVVIVVVVMVVLIVIVAL